MTKRTTLISPYKGSLVDLLAAPDYDGDGRTDPAVFRDGIWYQMRSTGGIAYVQWGLANDLPIQASFPE